MNYLEWNDLLAAQFFKPEMGGRKVFLFVTSEMLDRLGRTRQVDHADFVRAVIEGPPWAIRTGLCYRAYEAYSGWRQRGSVYPLYIGYLGLFVLAAGLDGDFAPHAYYPRLRTLIGEDPIIGQYPYFPHMRELWDDLERWSQEDKLGELGNFNVILAGKWRHVGIPIAQTLMTQEELEALPPLFVRAGLDPTSPPSDEDLAGIARGLGANSLRNRTLHLLQQPGEGDDELREALIQILQDELLQWNGTASGVVETPEARHPPRPRPPAAAPAERPQRPDVMTVRGGSLRLRCQYDRVAARMKVLLHCKSVYPFPEEGLVLTSAGDEADYECEDLASGWSSPLSRGDDGGMVDATAFDWNIGVELVDPVGSWRFTLHGSPVRIFVSGAIYGLGDLIEERRLPTAAPFYIAASRECCGLIARWGTTGCAGFRELPVLSGLPPGWRFFYAERANSDELVRDAFSTLALPRTTSLQFDGGIRVAAGNQFFTFAPPRVLVNGPDAGLQLECNGIPMIRGDAESHYLLPEKSPAGVRLVIEARRGQDEIARKTLSLLDQLEWPGVSAGYRIDAHGNISEVGNAEIPVFAGALTEHVDAPALVALPPFDVSRYTNAILLGRRPGEVASWPREDLPLDWTPVWAVIMRKRGFVVCCAPDALQASVASTNTGNRRLISMWKDVLWHRRKRIRPPTDPMVLALWREYQERARLA